MLRLLQISNPQNLKPELRNFHVAEGTLSPPPTPQAKQQQLLETLKAT